MSLLAFLLLGCTGGPADPSDTSGDTSDTSACLTDLPTGEKTAVGTDFPDGSEGVAFSGGVLYVAVPDGVMAYDGATWTRVATLDHALGLAAADGGVLVADPGEFTFDGSGDDGRLHYVGADGQVTTLATGMPNPNFVLAKGDGLLVSDDTAAIYEVRGDRVTTSTTDVPSPNGMGWAADGSALYVVSTFEPEPPLWRIPLEGGAAGRAEIVTRFDTGSAPDGLAVDADGGVWVALNLANEIVRVDPATAQITDMIDGVTTPASLAFGAGEGFDPCSLYVTELFGNTVWRVSTGHEGAPLLVAPMPTP